jgi:AraC-like DNA-binding protein
MPVYLPVHESVDNSRADYLKADQRESQFDLLVDAARAIYSISPLTEPNSLRAGWAVHPLDCLIISDATFTAMRFEHDPKKLHLYNNDYLLLEFYESGCGRGLVGQSPTYIDAQRIHLIDFSRHYRTVTGTVRTKGVLIPHVAVGYDPSREDSYYSLAADSPKGRMLTAAFQALFEQLPSIDGSMAPDLAAAFARLVGSLLLSKRPSLDQAAFTRARYDSICMFIEQHLDDPGLNAELLSRIFHLSRAGLYRLFKAHHGIDSYIRDRLLEQCFQDLRVAVPGRIRVREVAERWGFDNASHFHHRFKRRFGMTPSECLGISQPSRIDDEGSNDMVSQRDTKGTLANFLRPL